MIKKYFLLGLSLCAMQSYAAGLSYDFESNTDDWAARGSGSTTIELSTDQKHSGNQSLFVDKREASWNGALIENDYIQAGKTYKFSVWVFAKENATINLSIQYTSEGEANYRGIASKEVYAYGWTELTGEFVIPEDVTGIQPYIESNNETLSFYVDDFTCEEKVEETIDFSDQPALKDVFKNYFKIGTAVTASEITPANAKKLVLHHYNSVTPGNELKPDNMLDQANSISNGNNVNPQVKLAASTKTVLKFCSENNIPIRGHVFVWHSQTPDWFFNENFESNGKLASKEIMNQRMENYIKNVIEAVTTEYPKLQIYAWDIVNEAFHNDQGKMRDPGSNYQQEGTSKWMQVYGDSTFIYNAFKIARKYIPEGCKIYYNDFNEYIGSKRDGIYELVKNLYNLGLCDGIGMQSHLDTGFPSVELYKEAVAKYATIGCDIQITELDITLGNGANFETQANEYKQLFEVYKQYKDNISLVAFWGINDEISWRSSGKPLIYSNYKPKEAYWKIIEDMPITNAETVKATNDITVEASVKDVININCDGKFNYRVVSILGQETLKGTANSQAELQMQNIPAGVYVVEVKAANGQQKTVKVVKE